MEKDKLEVMIDFQKAFQKKLYPNFDPQVMTYEEKVNMTKQFVLYCHEELSEVMAAMKYKSYHKYEKTYNEEDIKVEIIDCLKFVLNLGILWGMSAQDFHDVFDKKSFENLKRIKAYDEQ